MTVPFRQPNPQRISTQVHTLRHRRSGVPAALLVLALVVGLVAALPAGATPGYPQAEVLIHGETIRVDVADTPDRQVLGLGGRERLGPLEGMLFIYAEKQRHTFWMRGMVIPIDMIWLDNHTVVHIEHDVPPPPAGQSEAALPTYRPDAPANFVLELAAGRARALGLRVGDRVRYRFGLGQG